MQNDDFCVKFDDQPPTKKPGSRRQSTSWDNDIKKLELNVPPTDSRRNSNTLAQLLECSRRLSSNNAADPIPEVDDDVEDILLSPTRYAGSRRASIAELADNGITTRNADDCVVVTQQLGTSRTFFFQKDPTSDNSFLRPSAMERGIFNFDNMIKETPKVRPLDTPRPSIQLHQPSKPTVHILSCSTISENVNENEPQNTDRTLSSHLDIIPSNQVSRRPSRAERGLPAVKFPTATTYITQDKLKQQDHERGRTLQKHSRRDPRLNDEFDQIIARRRQLIEQEEELRETLDLIPQKSKKTQKLPVFQKPHFYDGRAASPANTGIMDELRNQLNNGDVDRIVKEKKTTTVTETRETVYFTHRLPSSIAIATNLSPTGVPYNSNNRKSITSEGSLPPVLDRPYVRAQHDGKYASAEAKNPMKSVTIRVPPEPQQDYGTYRRPSTTSPQSNVRLLSSAEKTDLRLKASKFDLKVQHPMDDVADNCRQS